MHFLAPKFRHFCKTMDPRDFDSVKADVTFFSSKTQWHIGRLRVKKKIHHMTVEQHIYFSFFSINIHWYSSSTPKSPLLFFLLLHLFQSISAVSNSLHFLFLFLFTRFKPIYSFQSIQTLFLSISL